MRVFSRLFAPLAIALVLPARPAAAQDVAGGGGGGGPVPISLDEAVRQAQANSPLTVQAKGAARVASAGFKTAVAAMLPTLTIDEYAAHQQGLYYLGGVLTKTPGSWGYNKGYSLNMTVFNGGANILNLRSARAGLDAASQNEIVERFAVALSVKQQYFAVLAAREAESAATQQLKEANEQMAVTEAKVAGGAMSRADSLVSAVAVAQAKYALVSAQGSLVAANTALTNLVGGAHEVTALPSDTGRVPTISVDSARLVELALDGPAVQQAQHQVAADGSSWWAAIAAYLPTIGVSYNHGSPWSSPRFVLGGGGAQQSTNLAIFASYSLLDGFRRQSQITSADVARDNAKAQLRSARLSAREGIAQYLAQFRTAQTKIELQQLTIQSAEASVAAKDAQYRAGAVQLVDVLTQQTALAQARQALIQARLDARTAKAQIEALIGKDLG